MKFFGGSAYFLGYRALLFYRSLLGLFVPRLYKFDGNIEMMWGFRYVLGKYALLISKQITAQ